MEERSQWRLSSGQYLGEISALCFLHIPHRLSSFPFLLAGSGSQILAYDLGTGKMMRSFSVFEGIRVHGITSYFVGCTEKVTYSSNVEFKIVVFGERRVKVFSFCIDMVIGYPNNGSEICITMTLLSLLPKFGHWVLDVCFLKGSINSSNEENRCLAIGCSDNSVYLWDISKSNLVLQVQSPGRCLLYSMRLWGDNLKALRIASGTIFNEIIFWRVAPRLETSSLINSAEGQNDANYYPVDVCKLVGHEGSIFRLAWSSDGSKLVSVSDDRSSRVWKIHPGKDSIGYDPVDLVLFGHNARVWDCCIFEPLIITAGEDCTCRVWGLDGRQLHMIKEHLGRGIWRCLYDPDSLLLVTAGFDSAIKVHQLHEPLCRGVTDEQKSFSRRTSFSTCIPKLSEHVGLMDSKSEYVRCLRFLCNDTLYVATNHGYLFLVKLYDNGGARWNKLAHICDGAPIVCMDLLPKNSLKNENECGIEDWVAVGDGKGNMTIVGIICNDCTLEVKMSFTWPAEMERQLLGTYWCKTLGYRYIFTADPRGKLKLWGLCDPLQPKSCNSPRSNNVSYIAEFISSYGIRIMCLDASLEHQVLACGDLRGNLVVFPLSKGRLSKVPDSSEVKISPLSCFKGAHGISSVSSVSVAGLSCNQLEICSTGADGCICYLEYDRDLQKLEFIGMKQVKELSLIQSVYVDKNSIDVLSSGYATGFASVDFIIWNLTNETKVVRIPCGGWRRPYSYYLGDMPEMKNCFAYVKDEIIYIHRHWVHDRDGKIYPQSLHVQFHGREIHSLCFVYEDLHLGASEKHMLLSKSTWIATGCEDGTVRLTWYSPGTQNWSLSKLLGEHVGGSAVRSICCVSKLHIISSGTADVREGQRASAAAADIEHPVLLISVGAKRVLTSWLLRNRRLNEKRRDQQCSTTGDSDECMSDPLSSMSIQWLSTDMPAKSSSSHKHPENFKKIVSVTEKDSSEDMIRDKHEDDWRYLAVTAFVVKFACSRITVCFVVVACSDATLTLRALVLPMRLWFDVAILSPLVSPVLALQHIIFPISGSSRETIQGGNTYIVISGSTDGSIAFWDLSESIEAFMQWVSFLNVDNFDCQKRPRTGRGSQGGRWWRSLSSDILKHRPSVGTVASETGDVGATSVLNNVMHRNGSSSLLKCPEGSKIACFEAINEASPDTDAKSDNSPLQMCGVQPLHILNQIHQSGVNCLHVSERESFHHSESSGDDDYVYNVISGGDDQALNHLKVKFSLVSANYDTRNLVSGPENARGPSRYSQSKSQSYEIKFLSNRKIPSAHNSAVKGVWTDGSWLFSTGLDQRVRCWHLDKSEFTEHDCLLVSVPEPEALCAKACGENHYQIVVAGRGMQMVECLAC